VGQASAAVVVDVHFALLEELADPGLQGEYQGLLAADEAQRLGAMKLPARRLEYLCTRALCRTVLAAHTGAAPTSLRFGAGPHGKPELVGPRDLPPIAFNLSNTAGLVACAVVAPQGPEPVVELGVDVEALARRSQLVPIARRFFAPAEVADLVALPEGDRRRRFFDYWTLKESYIKARGMGLSLPLSRFFFQLAPSGPPRIDFAPGFPDQPGRWRFAQFAPTADHLGAVGVQTARPLAVRLHHVVPLRSPSLVNQSGDLRGPGQTP